MPMLICTMLICVRRRVQMVATSSHSQLFSRLLSFFLHLIRPCDTPETHTVAHTLSQVSCSIMHTETNRNRSLSKHDLVMESESQPSVLARITVRLQASAKEPLSLCV